MQTRAKSTRRVRFARIRNRTGPSVNTAYDLSLARRSPVTGTDVRHLAYRCNANDNYCFQSMRVRRRHSLGITMCWPLYRNICRIQDDRFCGYHLLKISREIFINAIPTRESGQFKVDSCLLMRSKSNMEKERCDRGGGVHDKLYGIQHAWKAEYIIVDNAGKCNVNFHYDLIEPGKKCRIRPFPEILLLAY